MDKINVFGVKINKVDMNNTLDTIEQYLKDNHKHYIVTPNIEFVMRARKDPEFKEILNKSDLAIPDSARFGWVLDELNEKNIFLKLLKWPLFIFPRFPGLMQFNVLTGIDLTNALIDLANKKAFTIGFLGGRDSVAVKTSNCLKKNYRNLKITFASNGGDVDLNGNTNQDSRLKIPPTDILFVAFGQVKQEKWIYKNLNYQPIKLMIGVGGSLDYLSGEVKRAPKALRDLGFEWFFRLIKQPWRIKRFLQLIKFTLLIIFSTT